ncbi:MAG: precorrin-3B synthase, partial [Mesorhizobium sp.]
PSFAAWQYTINLSAIPLPARGEIGCHPLLSPITNVARRVPSMKLPISPLEGEMPGRAEGGASR